MFFPHACTRPTGGPPTSLLLAILRACGLSPRKRTRLRAHSCVCATAASASHRVSYIYIYTHVSVRMSVLRESSLLEDLRAREWGTTRGHAFLGMDCVRIYTRSGTRWCQQCRGNVVLVGGRGACRRSLFFPLGRVLLGPQPRKHIAVISHTCICTYTYA